MSFVTTGANALIDRFEQLGLMSEDDLTAARFGLLFMGRIEGGADRLVTEIEFKRPQLRAERPAHPLNRPRRRSCAPRSAAARHALRHGPGRAT